MNLLAHYHQRSPSEQRALRWGAIALAILALWAINDWASQERLRMQRSLPVLNAQLEAMRTAIPQIQRLRDTPTAAPVSPDAQKAALIAAARASGLSLEITPDGNSGFNVRGQVDFDRWVEWLAQVQHDQRLRVARANVVRDGSSARIDASLAPAGS